MGERPDNLRYLDTDLTRRWLAEGGRPKLPPTETDVPFLWLSERPFMQQVVELELYGDSPDAKPELKKEVQAYGADIVLDRFRQDLELSEEEFEPIHEQTRRLVEDKVNNRTVGNIEQ